MCIQSRHSLPEVAAHHKGSLSQLFSSFQAAKKAGEGREGERERESLLVPASIGAAVVRATLAQPLRLPPFIRGIDVLYYKGGERIFAWCSIDATTYVALGW